MKKKKFLFSLSALILCFTQMVVHGDWTIKNGQLNRIVNKTEQINRHVVAYIKGRNRKFVSIEGAVTYADSLPGDKDYCVVVETGSAPVIESSFTINKNITLLISYDGETRSTKMPSEKGNVSSVTDFSLAKLTNQVIVNCRKDKLIITNNGTIEIGGELGGGNGGGNFAGHTAGRYAELVMGPNTELVNDGGTIDCYGYIKEGSRVYKNSKPEVTYTHNASNAGTVVNKSGNFNLPFILRDYRGGSSRVAIGNCIDDYHVSPFNQIEIRNVTCKITFDSKCHVVGWANLRTGEAVGGLIQPQRNSSDVRLIGAPNGDYNYLIEPSSDDFSFNAYYNPSTEIGTYDVYGGAKSNARSLKIKLLSTSKDISTENVFFPLSFRQKVVLHKATNQSAATYQRKQRFKILGGSYLEVCEGVSLEVGERCVYNQNDFIDAAEVGGVHYPSDKGDGKLVVNGSLIVDKFGGRCETKSPNASVKVISTASVDSYEAKTQEGSSAVPTGLKIGSTYKIDESLTLNQLVYRNNNEFSVQNRLPVGTYNSIEKENAYGFITNKTLYKINYYNVIDDSSFDEKLVNRDSMLKFVSRDTNSGLGVPSYSEGLYRYVSLYFDSSCSIEASKTNECFSHVNGNNEIDIFIKWVASDLSSYDIVYSYTSTQTKTGIDKKISNVKVENGYTIANNSDCGNYEIVNTGISKKKYDFVSWVLTDDNKVEKDLTFKTGDIISKETIRKYDNDGILKLEAKYNQTNYVYVKVNNKTYKGGWHNLVDYPTITSASVSGTQKIDLLKGNNDGYVCIDDMVTIEVDSSKHADPYCNLTINGKTIKINEGTTKTLDKNDPEFVKAITECKYPIIFDALA